MKVKLVSPFLLGAMLVAGLSSPATDEPSLPTPGASQAQAARAPEPQAARVRTVSVQKGAEAVTVWVHASGPLRYQTQMLSHPARLVVDLPQTILLGRRRQIPVDAEAVLRVRTAQFQAVPPVTRVVVDLREAVSYDIKVVPRGLKLTLFHTAPDVPVLAAEPQPRPQTPVLLASLAPVVPAQAAAELPDAPAPTTPQPNPPLLEAAKEVPAVEAQVPQLPQVPAPAPTPTPTVAAQHVCPRTPFTGEPISVDLKDVDLKDFFRLIHAISGFNIVLDPAVSGAVTLVLDEVPWDQALSIVLKNNNLGCQLEGNVLRIAAIATLKREEEDRRDLARVRAEAAQPVTTTRELSYAKASDMEQVLRKFLSQVGEIITDERTNTLIIRDIPQVLPQMDNIIKQLDRKSLQVEIEARVVTATRSFAREIGSQLAFSTAFTRGGGAGTAFGGATTIGDSGIEGGPGVPVPPFTTAGTLAPPLVSSFPATVDIAAGAGFTIAHRSQNLALDLIITAAEARGVGKLLSKPRVITQNNVLATVQQGTQIPIQTTVMQTVTVQYTPVVLKLEVTPHITKDGTIFLDVNVENTAINPGIPRINGIPALDTQQATTQVLINDGGTVVIGGVMTTETSYEVNQVPFLGSVPIIGHLFKRTSVSTRSSELLFFITPRIVPS
ncbi:MAG: type IV pilus secretin PilQ [Terriglobia bacterium]